MTLNEILLILVVICLLYTILVDKDMWESLFFFLSAIFLILTK